MIQLKISTRFGYLYFIIIIISIIIIIIIMRSLFRGATNSHEGQLHATPLKSTPVMGTRSWNQSLRR